MHCGCKQNKVKTIIISGKLIESSKEAKLKAENQRNISSHCFYNDTAHTESGAAAEGRPQKGMYHCFK